MSSKLDVRKGMPPRKLDREAFEKAYLSRFADPIFHPLQVELRAIVAAAWNAYDDGRKSPHNRKAGPGFADPDYEVATDWLEARAAIEAAQARFADPTAPSRILLVNGSSRTEHTCPGEMSKWRLVEIARAVFEEDKKFAVDVLDLSRTTSEYGKSPPRWRSAIGPAVAIRTIRSGRSMTG